MIEMTIRIDEPTPGKLMIVKEGKAENPTQLEEAAANRIHEHIQAAMDEESQRMNWSKSLSGPPDVITNDHIEAVRNRLKEGGE